jgi:uncharacterized membrane protein
MKNSLNIVIVVFVLIVLGCSCPKMEDIQKKIDESAKKTNSSDNAANTATKTAKDDDEVKDPSGLTMEKYNKIKNGMSYKEVKDIVGKEGNETMSSGNGKYKVTSYQWKGENYSFLSVVLMGDKVTSKTQANLE